ncbi:hypothetical protein JYJ95_31130 [Corallococcus exiguus]|uniref:hypothetical protein n=1 Tax=Corallococcus exiguus TaxID=83462 RepID=UPI001A8FCE01|nr:hypothetical protein [Corallococcus exiguus]MBN8470980.1 hypothetical protein [Corallococcus exiguus]
MSRCRISPILVPFPRKPQHDLPDKPPPGPAGLDVKPLASPKNPRTETHDNLPARPSPGLDGFDR